MIEENYLAILRCPIDPAREARIVMDDTRVVCERCRVHFKSREGFVSFVVEEAALPEGCPTVGALPCQSDGPA